MVELGVNWSLVQVGILQGWVPTLYLVKVGFKRRDRMTSKAAKRLKASKKAKRFNSGISTAVTSMQRAFTYAKMMWFRDPVHNETSVCLLPESDRDYPMLPGSKKREVNSKGR